jgi:hypothetical protein
MLKLFHLTAVTASLAAGACGQILDQQEKATFAVSQDVASQMLDRERRVVNGTGLGSLTLHGNGIEQQNVFVSITRAGSPKSVTCAVTIIAVSDQTSSSEVDCAKSVPSSSANEQTLREVLEVIVKEHVRATLQKTTYNVADVSNIVMTMIPRIHRNELSY